MKVTIQAAGVFGVADRSGARELIVELFKIFDLFRRCNFGDPIAAMPSSSVRIATMSRRWRDVRLGTSTEVEARTSSAFSLCEAR